MHSYLSDRVSVKDYLDEWVEKVNVPGFIEDDPILIPHRFNKKEDIEIAGFFAAILAWGQRKTIISKSSELINLMDNTHHNFIMQHQSSDLKRFYNFKHRTFQTTDLLYFIDFLKRHYTRFKSLEQAFYPDPSLTYDQERALTRFHQYFFDCSYSPERTRKHIATPLKKSTCKRLNMFLRWMVRKDNKGVDLGIWNTIPVSGLMIPLDVHVENTARKLKLISRPQRDWHTVAELTENLRTFDPDDPVKYDFALFGLGVLQIR